MKYINDPATKYVTYADAVNMAIKSGIEAQRAYIFLASFGIRGEQTRVFNADANTYGRPIKVAMRDDSTVVTSVGICKSCGTFKFT
jgi:hypothetical protein